MVPRFPQQQQQPQMASSVRKTAPAPQHGAKADQEALKLKSWRPYEPRSYLG